MKRKISLLLGACLLGVTAFGTACQKTEPATEEQPTVFDGWNPSNILEREVEKDDVLIGSWVTFADTNKGWSAIDQIERYHYAGINFMPLASTIPSKGMISKDEKTYLSRDLTSATWWNKVDDVMQEYNMVYYFSELGGLGSDYESYGRRTSMLSDEALSDARDIIPELNNCIGVHVYDEPFQEMFEECAKWARRYAAITNDDGETLGLDALVNHMGGMNYEMWMELAGATPNVLSHDIYPFLSGDATSTVFFGDMNRMRKLANEYGVKQACYPQSCSFSGRRMPNFEEIKWHINGNLVLGVTQFMYFNYIMYPNEGCADAIFALDGSVMYPETHESLSAFHKELRALDANVRLNNLDATEVYTTTTLSGVDSLPGGWIIDREGITSQSFLLSLFEPEKGSEDTTKYLSIFNNSFDKAIEAQEFLLGENNAITGLEVYNYQSGKFEPVQIINGAFTLSFEKSEVKFFRITGEVEA